MSKELLVAAFSIFLFLRPEAFGQIEKFAFTNQIFNIGLSAPGASNGQMRYCFYALKLTATPTSDPNKLAVTDEPGFGKRYDVGSNNITPLDPPVAVNVDPATSVIQGPLITNTSESTFQRKVGRNWITLTNQTVSLAAFINIDISDGGAIKGAYVYNYTRTQTLDRGRVVWRTNDGGYGGQVFAAYDGMSGSQLIGGE
jgi:hypothetical protein